MEYTIGVIGLWHLGSVYSAGLAQLGHQVIGFDINDTITNDLNQGDAPVYEKDLKELIQKNIREGRLTYTSKPEMLSMCDVIWVTLDTPIDSDGRPNTEPVKELVGRVLPHVRKKIQLIFSSQLPIGSKQEITSLIEKNYPTLEYTYLYQPENLQLGGALNSFQKPGRIIIGCDRESETKIIREIFAPLQTELYVMDVASAEMTKHALNAFLGTSLSFIYDIADICDAYGADVVQVTHALRLDPRIGKGAYLDASVGFSGGTLDRDLAVLLDKAKEKGKSIPVIASVTSKNKERFKIIANYLEKNLGILSDKTIGILGLTYKPGTSTLRHSLSLKLIEDLKNKVGAVRCFDPLIKGDEQEITEGSTFFSDLYEMMEGCHALILMTASPEYATLDFKKISGMMQEPRFFLDGKNFLKDKEEIIRESGIRYSGIGRGK